MVGDIYFKHNELKHVILRVCAAGWTSYADIIADIRTIRKFQDYDKQKALSRIYVLSVKRTDKPTGKNIGYNKPYLRKRIAKQTHVNGVDIREYSLTKKGRRMLCEFDNREWVGASLKWDGVSYRPYGCNNECSICTL